MKALVFDNYGPAAEVLKLKDVPEPQIGDGEVKVKILLSPINPSDIYNTIEGTYRKAVGRTIWNYGRTEDEQLSIDPEGVRNIAALPHTPGLEAVGIVVDAGKGLRGRMLKGRRVVVIGQKRGGHWREYNVVDANQALPVNKHLTDEQAATSFINPVTAYVMVKEVLKCRKGEFLMQSASNSELGKMVIRLGKHFGFKTINLVRNIEQAEHLKSIGADHVIDITSGNLKEQVAAITGNRGVSYALDCVGGELASQMVQCLGIGGHMLVYGTLTLEPMSFSPRDLMTPVARVEGFFLTNYIGTKPLLKKLSIIRAVGKLIRQGVLQSEIGPVFDIEDYKAALEAVNQPGNKGKVLLRMHRG